MDRKLGVHGDYRKIMAGAPSYREYRKKYDTTEAEAL